MTDRELLELAAKAAGLADAEYQDWPAMEMRYGFACAIWSHSTGYWNPLEDDGHALRLAVKLGMEVYHADDDGMAAYASWPNARGIAYAIEQHGTDPNAATRRAIVRAAAEIERSAA
jgi:hypothetical protein